MSPEDYAFLVDQHHDYIKTGMTTPSMRTRSTKHPALDSCAIQEKRFTLDQSQIIKCNLDEASLESGFGSGGSALLDRL